MKNQFRGTSDGMSELEVCVEVSREWEGRKVAEDLVNKIKMAVQKPKFILLFATIDYEKDFKTIISGIKSKFSDSPLVGGTVAGFTTPEGCYTRGVTVMALNYPNMDVAVGLGRNTKRNPDGAAKECAKMLKAGLKSSRWKGRFLFDIISGTEIPNIPGVGRGVIKSTAMSKMVRGGMRISQFLIQKSIGREEDVLDEMLKMLPEFNILGGSSIDNVKMSRNFQFFNTSVLTNSVVCLGMATDLKFESDYGHGAEVDKEFAITKISGNKQIVFEINNKPASEEFPRVFNKPKDIIFDEKSFLKRFPFFPCGVMENGKLMIRPFVMILKDALMSMSKFKKDKVFTLSISGKSMIKATNDILKLEQKPEFGIFMSCALRLMTLGSEIFKERDALIGYFKDKPFLVIYTAGENVRKANEELYYLNESIAGMMFWR
ncbi:MAG: hypothetical protein JXB23_06995 [Candidatus Aminicenantes bacterium]|nr:hypothetical protein [Candidatus Aminicenantes bacterium]